MPEFATTPHRSGRRRFLKTLGAAGVVTIVGSGIASPFRNPLTAWALPGLGNDTVLVSIFLRGGADGLNIVCPHGDDDYYDQRGSYALSGDDYDDLDGFFGLNASFGALLPLWNENRMAAVQAVGSHLPDRSHFVSQPNMETGLAAGGWMQRAIGASAFAGLSAGLSIGDRISPQLAGPFNGAVVDTIEDARDAGMSLATARPGIEALYAAEPVPALEANAVSSAFMTIDDLAGINPAPGDFPDSNLGQDLKEAASLIRADIGVRCVAVDSGDWDHHVDGLPRMRAKGIQISEAIAAFMADLGQAGDRVMVIVSTEFGRTVRKNGSGTDHGHGSMMLAFGDRLDGQGGGKVLVPGGWPGLSEEQQWDGRDLAITTDFRSVYAELAERHLGVTDTATIFPGFVREHVGLLLARGDMDGSGVLETSDVQTLLNRIANGSPTFRGDVDGDGDMDLADALLLAQQVEQGN